MGAGLLGEGLLTGLRFLGARGPPGGKGPGRKVLATRPAGGGPIRAVAAVDEQAARYLGCELEPAGERSFQRPQL